MPDARRNSPSSGPGLVQRDVHREGGLRAGGPDGREAHAGEVPEDGLGRGGECELGEEEAEDDLCPRKVVRGAREKVGGGGEVWRGQVVRCDEVGE